MPGKIARTGNIYRVLQFLILMIGIVCFGSIVILLLFFTGVQYPHRVNNYVSNAVLLVPAVAAVWGCVRLIRSKRTGAIYDKIVGISVPILFLLQIFVFYQIFFESGWDAGTVADGAFTILNHDTEFLNTISFNYLSHCQNNLLLTWIISVLLKINRSIGLFGTGYELMIVTVVNSALSLWTSVLVYRVLSLLGAKKITAFLGYWVSVFLLAFSPWNVICYSDPLSLVFPVLLLYIGLRGDIPRPLQWGLIAGIGYVGYRIKPTVVIVLIALVGIRLLEVFRKLADNRRITFAGVLQRAGALLLALVTVVTINVAIEHAYSVAGFIIDDNQKYSLYHFLMMGQNDETNGVYYEDDVVFSKSFYGYDQRKEANKEVALERIKNRGLTGQLVFTARKALCTYNDGTFAWAEEGNFYSKLKPCSSQVSELLRNVFYSTGKYYAVFKIYTQYLWWTTILLVVASLVQAIYGMLKGRVCSQAYMIVLSSLIGITLYNALFETRARYLYIYVPFYIICAMLGLQRLAEREFVADDAGLPEKTIVNRAVNLFPMGIRRVVPYLYVCIMLGIAAVLYGEDTLPNLALYRDAVANGTQIYASEQVEVYLTDDQLLYVTDNNDNTATYFLHYYTDMDSAEDPSQFLNDDFLFGYYEERMPFWTGKQMSIRALPLERGLRSVETGQYTDEGILWEATYDMRNQSAG